MDRTSKSSGEQIRASINEILKKHGLPQLTQDDDDLMPSQSIDSLLVVEIAFKLERDVGLNLDWHQFDPRHFLKVSLIESRLKEGRREP